MDPSVISHYKILDKLGEGGMGVVFRAEDTRLDRVVALKFLPSHLRASSDALARFIQEAKAASALNHPNICTIHSIEEEGDQQFIVMECVDGLTMRRILQGGPLDRGKVIDYAIQIADGLTKAHAKEIVHRDIKSDNIMVTGDGLVKIMDFGLAKLRGVSSLTREGSTLGTLGYMSPEQLHGLDPDHRSDIYAFGVLFYEMLTGRLPFQGAHEAALMYEIANASPPRPSTLRPDTDPRIENIVLRCLEKNREDRYQSIQEVAAALREIRGSGPISREIPATSPVKVSREWTRRRILQAGVVGLVVIGAVVAVILLSRRGETIDSIAVLPFVNQSHDPNAEYLSDGITEQIMNKLSQIPTIRVIPRSTVFAYKGKEMSAQAIGEELKVKAVLSGRVLMRGNSLNIQTELIDVNKQAQLWGEQYTRTTTDILGLQDDIAKQISSNLRLRLTGAEQKRLEKRYTENAEAYELYLKGNFLVQKLVPDDLKRGLELLNQSLTLDPQFPLPYLGRAYYNALATDFYLAPHEAMPAIKRDVTRALELDDQLADAHTWLGWYYIWYEHDGSKSEKEFQRAIELNPASGLVYECYSFLLLAQQRIEEAVVVSRKGTEAEPLNPERQAFHAISLFYARRYDESLVQLQKVAELDPNYPFYYMFKGLCYVQQGRLSDGVAEIRASDRIFDAPWSYAHVAYAEARAGRKAEALAILDSLKNRSRKEYVASDIVAGVYVALGDREKAFEYLDKGFDERAGWMVWLKVDPVWDPIRSDQRFAAILKRMNLEAAPPK